MATKTTASKAVKKAPAKKAAAKKAPAKKAAAKKVAPAKDSPFHLYDEGGKKFIPADKAKAVKVPGFDDFRFFIHKSADGKGWTISEATSGGRISVGRTQKEAREKAAEALGKHGQEDLAESIKRSIAKNGTAPGFEDAAKATGKHTAKKTFSVTTDDGTEVEVTFDAEFRNHLEFRGEVSPTGYRSHFGYNGKGKVEDAAREIAGYLRAEFLEEQAKQARKGRKKAKGDPVAPVIKAGDATIKGRIVEELCAQHKLGCPQVHESDLIKTAGRPAPDVTATLMILELEGRIKSLPGKFYRMAKREDGKPSGNRGRKPNGAQCLGSQKRAGTREAGDAENSAHRRGNARRGQGLAASSRLSQLDAAVKILTDAGGALTCKEIIQRMFEQKLWNTSGRTPGATLSASMQREIAKRGSEARFRRAERGLYELNA